ncbi:major facilitator superfamily domain-containing protein [Suillus clintonianus]|uniref:major facilitator superfamily domain-containing protein n=1 Tax=Suillus clintonianus TaxID=1904413 RepID=UPI001B871B4B|nr:major facilitator superfamily domain-containing protein [Suillus clintonianus]KAG2118366.1 major facilitator superfamily domain-containing protein [Suillus clintonianus]
MGLSFRDIAFITALCGVTTLNVFLVGAVTVALPTIGKDLDFQEGDLYWPINVNSLSYGGLLLFCGRLGDIFGGRLMFVIGSLWFAIWSLATAFVPNSSIFIVDMALLGIGSAANTPAAIGLCSSYFPPGANRNKAFSALGVGSPVGFILGLIASGLLTESRATWRSLFCIQAGLALFFVCLALVVIPKDHSNQRYVKGLDWVGAVLSTAGLGLLVFSLSDSTTTQKGWLAPQVLSLFLVSIVLLVTFVFFERWRESRNMSVLMPLSIWRQPGAKLGPLIGVVFFGWFSFDTLSYFFTLYYQQVQLLDPLQTSLRFIPMAIAGVIPSVAAGYFVASVPAHILMLIGLLVSTAASVIYALINPDIGFWHMGFFMMITIVGVDIVYSLGNQQITVSFDEDSQSLAGGIFSVTTRLATALGLAVTSEIADSVSKAYNNKHPDLDAQSPEVLMVGFRAAGWTCFASTLLGIVIVILGLRGLGIIGKKTRATEDAIQSDNDTLKLHQSDPESLNEKGT